MTEEKLRIFISYAREDERNAIRLYKDFMNSALPIYVWLDKEDILPGQDWNSEIIASIKKSDFFIPLFSSISVEKRGYVQREFKLAVDTLQEIPPGRIFVIPVRLDECEIKYEELKKYQRQDLFPDWYQGLSKILKSIDVYIQNINLERETESPSSNSNREPQKGVSYPAENWSKHSQSTLTEKAAVVDSPLSQKTRNTAILFTELRDGAIALISLVSTDWIMIYQGGTPAMRSLLYRTAYRDLEQFKNEWTSGMEYVKDHNRSVFDKVSFEIAKLQKLIDELKDYLSPLEPKIDKIRPTTDQVLRQVDTIYEIAASSIER